MIKNDILELKVDGGVLEAGKPGFLYISSPCVLKIKVDAVTPTGNALISMLLLDREPKIEDAKQ